MIDQFPWLTLITLLPLAAALGLPFLPTSTDGSDAKMVRWYALGVSLLEFSLTIFVFWQHYDFQTASLQLAERWGWIPQLGLNWSLAVDGLSMPLIVLTGLVNTLAVLASWKVNLKPRLYYALLLILYSAQVGVFAAQDLLLFFLNWELELIPVYLLIAIWGGPKRLYAATKFILYTALGSIFILVAGLAMAFQGDTVTFDLTELGLKQYGPTFELLAYAGFLIAFAVKLPIFPLHTWLPDAHGEASAPVSMILAGVLLKMGGYGLIRMNLELFPDAHIAFAPVLVILGIVNIVYGALTAFAQTNLKRRLACSSISHMGFVLIGIASLTDVGLNGAMLQMLSHGLIAAALFYLAGVTYDRTHTLAMEKMGGIGRAMPTVFALFTTGSMASLALPGMSGFVSELTIFIGLTASDAYTTAFKVVAVGLAAVGLLLTPVYLLSMLRQVFFGTQQTGEMFDKYLGDAKPREVFIAACLLLPILGIGFYPRLATNVYDLTTVAIASQLRQSLPVIAQPQPPLYARSPYAAQATAMTVPQLSGASEAIAAR